MKNQSKSNFKRSIERYLCFLCENAELIYAEYAYENILADLKAKKRLIKFAKRMEKKYPFPSLEF
jgi:hypothetical protein